METLKLIFNRILTNHKAGNDKKRLRFAKDLNLEYLLVRAYGIISQFITIIYK